MRTVVAMVAPPVNAGPFFLFHYSGSLRFSKSSETILGEIGTVPFERRRRGRGFVAPVPTFAVDQHVLDQPGGDVLLEAFSGSLETIPSARSDRENDGAPLFGPAATGAGTGQLPLAQGVDVLEVGIERDPV